MKRVIVSVALAIVLLLSYVPSLATADEAESRVSIVSMVQLLARPSDFDGRVVRVAGYLAVGFGLRLYLTRDHASIADSASALSVSEPTEQLARCAGAYVTVMGTARATGPNTIEFAEIRQIDRWADDPVRFSTCWARTP